MQQSPLTLFPSSQASWASTTPSPQLGGTQVVRQALGVVSELKIPLSQISPASITPSPQRGSRHVVRQALGVVFEFAAPSSHSSPLSITPSPQRGSRQSVRQALGVVSELAAPSSHCSQATSRTPSPQVLPLPMHCPESSHRSVGVQGLKSSQVLPAATNWHVLLQQSPSSALPSSHCSGVAVKLKFSKTPLPHTGGASRSTRAKLSRRRTPAIPSMGFSKKHFWMPSSVDAFGHDALGKPSWLAATPTHFLEMNPLARDSAFASLARTLASVKQSTLTPPRKFLSWHLAKTLLEAHAYLSPALRIPSRQVATELSPSG